MKVGSEKSAKNFKVSLKITFLYDDQRCHFSDIFRYFRPVLVFLDLFS